MNKTTLSGSRFPGKTAKRMTKANIETFIGNRGNCLISLPLTQLYEWIGLLQKDGINSKQTVLDQIKNILKGTE